MPLTFFFVFWLLLWPFCFSGFKARLLGRYWSNDDLLFRVQYPVSMRRTRAGGLDRRNLVSEEMRLTLGRVGSCRRLQRETPVRMRRGDCGDEKR